MRPNYQYRCGNFIRAQILVTIDVSSVMSATHLLNAPGQILLQDTLPAIQGGSIYQNVASKSRVHTGNARRMKSAAAPTSDRPTQHTSRPHTTSRLRDRLVETSPAMLLPSPYHMIVRPICDRSEFYYTMLSHYGDEKWCEKPTRVMPKRTAPAHTGEVKHLQKENQGLKVLGGHIRPKQRFHSAGHAYRPGLLVPVQRKPSSAPRKSREAAQSPGPIRIPSRPTSASVHTVQAQVDSFPAVQLSSQPVTSELAADGPAPASEAEIAPHVGHVGSMLNLPSKILFSKSAMQLASKPVSVSEPVLNVLDRKMFTSRMKRTAVTHSSEPQPQVRLEETPQAGIEKRFEEGLDLPAQVPAAEPNIPTQDEQTTQSQGPEVMIDQTSAKGNMQDASNSDAPAGSSATANLIEVVNDTAIKPAAETLDHIPNYSEKATMPEGTKEGEGDLEIAPNGLTAPKEDNLAELPTIIRAAPLTPKSARSSVRPYVRAATARASITHPSAVSKIDISHFYHMPAGEGNGTEAEHIRPASRAAIALYHALRVNRRPSTPTSDRSYAIRGDVANALAAQGTGFTTPVWPHRWLDPPKDNVGTPKTRASTAPTSSSTKHVSKGSTLKYEKGPHDAGDSSLLADGASEKLNWAERVLVLARAKGDTYWSSPNSTSAQEVPSRVLSAAKTPPRQDSEVTLQLKRKLSSATRRPSTHDPNFNRVPPKLPEETTLTVANREEQESMEDEGLATQLNVSPAVISSIRGSKGKSKRHSNVEKDVISIPSTSPTRELAENSGPFGEFDSHQEPLEAIKSHKDPVFTLPSVSATSIMSLKQAHRFHQHQLYLRSTMKLRNARSGKGQHTVGDPALAIVNLDATADVQEHVTISALPATLLIFPKSLQMQQMQLQQLTNENFGWGKKGVLPPPRTDVPEQTVGNEGNENQATRHRMFTEALALEYGIEEAAHRVIPYFDDALWSSSEHHGIGAWDMDYNSSLRGPSPRVPLSSIGSPAVTPVPEEAQDEPFAPSHLQPPLAARHIRPHFGPTGHLGHPPLPSTQVVLQVQTLTPTVPPLQAEVGKQLNMTIEGGAISGHTVPPANRLSRFAYDPAASIGRSMQATAITENGPPVSSEALNAPAKGRRRKRRSPRRQPSEQTAAKHVEVREDANIVLNVPHATADLSLPK